jgi:hypothetical protein
LLFFLYVENGFGTGSLDIEKKEQDDEPEDTTNLMLDA